MTAMYKKWRGIELLEVTERYGLTSRRLARCSVCGTRMVAYSPIPPDDLDIEPEILCPRLTVRSSHLRVPAEAAVEFVEGEVLKAVNDGGAVTALREAAAAAAPSAVTLYSELADLTRERRALADRFVAGDVSDAEWREERKGFEERFEAMRHQLAALPRGAALVALPEPLDRETWSALPSLRRDDIVAALVRQVRVGPEESPRQAVAERLSIEWVDLSMLQAPGEDLDRSSEDQCVYCGRTLAAGELVLLLTTVPFGSQESPTVVGTLCQGCREPLEFVLNEVDLDDPDPFRAVGALERLIQRRKPQPPGWRFVGE